MRSSTSLFALAVISTMTFASAVCSAQQSPQSGTSTMEERQQTCNAQASEKNLAGDPRKAFMSDCLTGQSTEGSGGTTAATQQKLEQSCNTTAMGRHLTGDDLKSFLAECLKGETTPSK